LDLEIFYETLGENVMYICY